MRVDWPSSQEKRDGHQGLSRYAEPDRAGTSSTRMALTICSHRYDVVCTTLAAPVVVEAGPVAPAGEIDRERPSAQRSSRARSDKHQLQ